MLTPPWGYYFFDIIIIYFKFQTGLFKVLPNVVPLRHILVEVFSRDS